jgi:hypothetical protein
MQSINIKWIGTRFDREDSRNYTLAIRLPEHSMRCLWNQLSLERLINRELQLAKRQHPQYTIKLELSLYKGLCAQLLNRTLPHDTQWY